MSYLVTGATGFIGTNIVEQLANEGATVVGLSNVEPSQSQKKLTRGGKAIFVKGDVRDQEKVESILRTHLVRSVIHAAVITSNAEREKTAGPLIVDVNLHGTAVMAMAAANTGVEKFAMVSSAGVFSTHNLPDGIIVDENYPHRVNTLYGIGKSAAEAIVSRICSLNSLPFVIGRLATAFGPWEHDTGFRDTLSPIYQLTMKARTGQLAVLERDKRSNWHYARDAASALITLARPEYQPRHNDYNLGPEWVWPLSDWCRLLAKSYPAFSYEIGDPANIELYGSNDGAVLSGNRFAEEFGAPARFDLEASFDDFMRWMDD